MVQYVIIGVITMAGIVFAVWSLKRNAGDIEEERQQAIEAAVASKGGEIVAVEQIERENCPYSEEFSDTQRMYKFYRIRYEVDGRRKLGYGILCIEPSPYGPSLSAATEWKWHL